ncbi:MAG: AraC family transcriptional regulator [Sulfitobacter sp.]
MDLVIVELASTATLAITLFGIVFCLSQTEYSRVSRSFAVFLGAIALNNVPDALHRIFATIPAVYVQTAELVIWSASNLCLAPLFWMYVFTLTSSEPRPPARLYRHLLLPALSVLLGLIITVSAQDAGAALFSDKAMPSSVWSLTLILVFGVLQIAVYPQLAVYLFLILRRLMRYRRMLRDVYASTEKHELRWIYVIGGFAALFWVTQTLILLIAFDSERASAPPVFLNIAALTGLALVGTTTLWGLRQRPPLVPDPQDVQASDISGEQPSEQPAEKYEKSALTAEASMRIARKLRMAMEKDHLHRDPNISLWVLARHIGASPNYISQTLSEVIGASFFDFVNGYRIADAMALLSTTDDTILTITYEVGFNARSSFYNAFKRVTGQTPTHYRKTLSHPVGMDDTKA